MKSADALTQLPERETSFGASHELTSRELGGLGLHAIARLHSQQRDELELLPQETGGDAVLEKKSGRAAERVAQILNRQAWESRRIENIAKQGGYTIVVDTGETIIRG